MSAEVIVQQTELPTAIEYIVGENSDVSERETLFVIAAYAKGYRDAIVSISEAQPTERPLVRSDEKMSNVTNEGV